MSGLGPSPTAVTAAAKARARMLRPGLPPRGGAARGPPPHSHPFRPPSEPAPAAPGGAEAGPPAHSAEEGTEAAGGERGEAKGLWPRELWPLSAELGTPPRAKSWVGFGARGL